MDLQAMSRPHRRFNPLRGEWVLVSPQRTARPWQGQTSKPMAASAVHYDPQCYLCPGNARAGGEVNPKYTSIFAFDNDYPALLPADPAAPAPVSEGLLIAEAEVGRCRVVCFDPDHSLTLSGMSHEAIVKVVEAWQQETRDLGAQPEINYVTVFENRGAMMGSSNPHPHCQIWATGHIPNEPAAEGTAQKRYFDEHGRTLLLDYRTQEVAAQERVVYANESFVAMVPFWAVWPFELLIVATETVSGFAELTPQQVDGLADMLKRVTMGYDALFETSFPYTLGFHQHPSDRPDSSSYPEWEFHAHFYPPLLRSAEIRKFMVGFEMLGMPQRDITPEKAAEMLREAGQRSQGQGETR